MNKIKLFTFVTIFSICSLVASDELNSLFVRDYFLNKEINQVVAFACWSSPEIIQFVRLMMESNIKISYIDDYEKQNMQIAMKVNYYKLGVFLDLDCPQGEDIFTQFATVNNLPFNVSYFWLTIIKSDKFPTETVTNLPLTVASELTTTLIHENKTYVMYDVYNHSYRHGGRINITYMGFWNENNGINIFFNQYKYKRRGDFHGLVLNFSTVFTNTPRPDLKTYMTTSINPHLDPVGRFQYELVKQLSDMYNFTIHMTVHKSWGYVEKEKVSGLIGDLYAGIVDVSAVGFYFNKARLSVTDFTVQTYYASPALLFRHPKKNKIHNIFINPFEDNVWLAILTFAIIFWVLLLFMIESERKFEKNKSEINGLYTNKNTATFLVVMAAITQQDSNDIPKFYSNRIFFVSTFLWGMLLFQFYSASIVGSLLAERPRFINTVYDLLKSDIEIGIDDVIYNRRAIEHPPDNRCRALKKRVEENTRKGKRSYFNSSEGLSRMKNGQFAFLVDVAIVYKHIEETFTENEICELTEIKAYDGEELGIVTSKRSPFNKMIVYGLRKSVAGGITRRHRTIWYPRRPQCPPGHSSKPVPVEFGEFSSAILLLFGGLGVAAFILIIEKIIQKKNSQPILPTENNSQPETNNPSPLHS